MKIYKISVKDKALFYDAIRISQYDHQVQCLEFSIPLLNDGLNVEDFNIHIETQIGSHTDRILMQPEISDNLIIFKWLLTATVTQFSGRLAFEIQLEGKADPDISVWQSAKGLIQITQSINGESQELIGPSLLTQWEQQMVSLSETAEQASEEALLIVERADAGEFIGEKGEPGPQGLIGEPGPQGNPGIQGLTGATGPPGAAGVQGPKGDQGESGIQGPTGPKGDKGDQGDPGNQGPAGEKGEQGIQGPQGLTGASVIIGLSK